ncbi:hypothetical protein TNCV_2940361 [Trichonephila clavipes]|nr:hypothetical protein TNCV_2940361 [Trichonephila clavipes]
MVWGWAAIAYDSRSTLIVMRCSTLPTSFSDSSMADRSPDLSPVEHVWDQLKRQMPSINYKLNLSPDHLYMSVGPGGLEVAFPLPLKVLDQLEFGLKFGPTWAYSTYGPTAEDTLQPGSSRIGNSFHLWWNLELFFFAKSMDTRTTVKFKQNIHNKK